MSCRLCDENTKLEQSHLIPKFIFRWIKKTSLTGKLRNNATPDRRSEDGDKMAFLCPACEDLFSKYETFFANNLFNRATENNLSEIVFTDKLLKFIVSIIWRNLKYRLEMAIKLDELTECEISKFNEFLTNCGHFFKTNDIYFLENYSFHIIPLTESMENLNIIPRLTSTNQRGVDSSFRAFSKENLNEGYDYLCYYVKLPFFLFICEVIKNEKYRWFNTDVKNLGSSLSLNRMIVNNLVSEILRTSYKNKILAANKVSNTQIKKIQDSASNTIRKGVSREQLKSIVAKNRENNYIKKQWK